ncbi:MAG: hypothetical protein U1E65_33435 [Myxococcota bacterium]
MRTILLDRRAQERKTSLFRLQAGLLSEVGLPQGRVDRSHAEQVINGKAPARFGGARTELVVRRDVWMDHLAQRADAERVGVVDGRGSIEIAFELDGWRVSPRSGEAIRAPVLLLAESARAPLLEAIGVGEVQRMTKTGAEIATNVIATWELPPSEMQKHGPIRVFESRGPLGRVEVLPGRDRVTLSVGPVWAGLHVDEGPWPSPAHPAILHALERARVLAGLPPTPTTVELEEWRLDALPNPPTFDGGMVVGAGAGQRRHDALGAEGDAWLLGRAAGQAAAAAVLKDALRAKAIGALLTEAHHEVVLAIDADRAWEARPRPRAKFAPGLSGLSHGGPASASQR